MPRDEFNLACQSVSTWHEKVTFNLRQIRQSIKILAQEDIWLDNFYQQVLRDEILSESYQQALLYQISGKKKIRSSKNDDLAYRYLSWLFDSMGHVLDEPKKKKLRDLVTIVYGSF